MKNMYGFGDPWIEKSQILIIILWKIFEMQGYSVFLFPGEHNKKYNKYLLLNLHYTNLIIQILI